MDDGHVFTKKTDTNISICVYATLLECYDGSHISVHEDQDYAYRFVVPHWTAPNNIMLARGENELEVGMSYILQGCLSVNEGEGWTRTAFEIDDAIPLSGAIDVDNHPRPSFRLLGLVIEAKDEELLLGWERLDEDLGNFAWVYVKASWGNANEDMLFKKYWIDGDMDGPDRMNDWVVTTAVPRH